MRIGNFEKLLEIVLRLSTGEWSGKILVEFDNGEFDYISKIPDFNNIDIRTVEIALSLELQKKNLVFKKSAVTKNGFLVRDLANFDLTYASGVGIAPTYQRVVLSFRKDDPVEAF